MFNIYSIEAKNSSVVIKLWEWDGVDKQKELARIKAEYA